MSFALLSGKKSKSEMQRQNFSMLTYHISR